MTFRWLTDEEQAAWRGYRRMRTLLDLQLARDLARDAGLSEADYDVLSTLTEGGGPPWRATELANRLLWSTSRLAHQVRRMEQRGLVCRHGVDDDRRGASIDLTELGWNVLREAAPDHVNSVRQHFIDLLTRNDIRALTRLSGKVIDHLDPRPSREDPPGSR